MLYKAEPGVKPVAHQQLVPFRFGAMMTLYSRATGLRNLRQRIQPPLLPELGLFPAIASTFQTPSSLPDLADLS
jgi:hypothetical protein